LRGSVGLDGRGRATDGAAGTGGVGTGDERAGAETTAVGAGMTGPATLVGDEAGPGDSTLESVNGAGGFEMPTVEGETRGLTTVCAAKAAEGLVERSGGGKGRDTV
jgi:hypothetical protein